MGIHGLTTYLRENKRTLSRSVQFSPAYVQRTPLVVDGWSFIYRLAFDSQLPWVYGGEYAEFSKLTIKVVEAWLAVGLQPIFVFDGPIPPEKFATCIARLNQSQVKNSLLFFRTSAASRKTPRFLLETFILPPLARSTCVQTLLSVPGVEVYFADGECDPYAVELAGRLGGYVAGQDSDFVALNCEGYLGYLPLDDLTWTAEQSHVDLDGASAEADEFKTVVRYPKKKSVSARNTQRGVIPPEVFAGELTLTAALYEPSVLARHFNLPTSLLPLLGALVGNDFTTQASTGVLFERRLTPTHRITHAAAVLSAKLHGTSAPGNSRKLKTPRSVLHLIEMTVTALVGSSTAPANMTGSAEQAALVDQIVDATLPYAIRLQEDSEARDEGLCKLHAPSTCPLLAALERPEDSLMSIYLRAYREGRFAPALMDVLTTGTYWPRLFLENPDLESVSRTIGRGTREFGYALLHYSSGLPVPTEEREGEEQEANSRVDLSTHEDEDEVIDVSEEHSDAEDELQDVDSLRGALRDLSFEEDEEERVSVVDAPPDSECSSRKSDVHRWSAGPKLLTEYVRKGSRIIAEEVVVLTTVAGRVTSPLLLRSEDVRLKALLQHLRSDYASIREVDPVFLMVVLALRMVIRRLHERAQESQSKERQKERWTQREALALLSTFGSDDYDVDALPEISDRSVQLTVQFLTAVENIQHLTQILLLTEAVPNCSRLYSGRRFHALLWSKKALQHPAWTAVSEDVNDCFAPEPVQRSRKRKSHLLAKAQPHRSVSYNLLDVE